MTGSRPLSHLLAASGLTKRGWSKGGMPSRGGPPLDISLRGTLCLEKSVFHPSRLKPAPARSSEGEGARPELSKDGEAQADVMNAAIRVAARAHLGARR